jgi:hypothetical protein
MKRIKFCVAAGALLGLAGTGAALWPLQAAEPAKVPNFATNDSLGWTATDDDFLPPPSGPGPVLSDPKYPYVSFYKFPRNPKPSYRVADLTNPILQPWTREALRKANEKSLSGAAVTIPKERCVPAGVPAFLLYPSTPVYFLQTPKKVTLIWAQDHQVRHIYLDQKHSENVKPSWFGESVGHYEGDTLVVDTIGLDIRSYVDNYLTPHSPALHVVERFRIADDGKTMDVNIRVEDPVAFTTPWTAVQRYRRTETSPLTEFVCAENNGDHFNHGIDPIPQDDTPDF